MPTRQTFLVCASKLSGATCLPVSRYSTYSIVSSAANAVSGRRDNRDAISSRTMVEAVSKDWRVYNGWCSNGSRRALGFVTPWVHHWRLPELLLGQIAGQYRTLRER